MAHYLVVAHRVRAVDELSACVQRVVQDDQAAACTLLVTATQHPSGFSGPPILERQALAWASSARDALRDGGLYLAGTLAGDAAADVAVEDELRAHPDRYDAVVICTPSRRGVRGWIEGDLRARIEQRVPLPVFSVGGGTTSLWGRQPQPRLGWLSRIWGRTRLRPRPADNLVPTRRQMIPYLALMLVYLLGGLTLAILINRGFFLNDFVALCLYTLVIGGLILALRMES